MTHSPSPPSNGWSASLVTIGQQLARIEYKLDRIGWHLTRLLLTSPTSSPTAPTCPTSTAPTTPLPADGPPIAKELLWPLARWLAERLAALIARAALPYLVPIIGLVIIAGRKLWEWFTSWLAWLVG
jgi:hypothetical protein